MESRTRLLGLSMIRTWTCRRCGERWERIYSRCQTPECEGRKPPRRIPKHREIMAVPYERWVEQFGEVCGICGAKPKPGKRLKRDHAHREPYGARGLLCFRCNRFGIPYWVDTNWALNLAKYLDRSPITRL
jgi:hypothetical protein